MLTRVMWCIRTLINMQNRNF